MNISELPEFLTVKEVAKILRLSETTIRRWAREGTLISASIGNTTKHYRFSRKVLLDLVKEASQPQQA